ncbi:alpha/beta hydrolase [Acinetobacter rathckeae]|uniref:alpha/beta hydrolase n=1 Tax=Acinetobacter rathckeae TaxID=2605272 RepID=UPI0018A2D0CB|nr:alpha/beta hydrolase [Acinetobacter rathckeae]MBF7688637.1 alpha/beta hydrolase [Acinetobacter rathckeae]MBF7695883.1 alpha/beta hydrolase [Acinetobacter rathckeae]
MGKMIKRQRITTRIKKAHQAWKDFRAYEVVSRRLNQSIATDKFFLTENVAYGEHERQNFDLYRAVSSRQDRALIVFVHGGTWARGDKSDYAFVAESFTQDGFDVLVLNYRLAPQHRFPDYVSDLIHAVNYLHAQQQELSISTENLVLMGHSAGAFNIMSALYHKDAQDVFDGIDQIKAVIGLAGPYHFNYANDKNLQQAFPVDKHYKQIMPYYFVTQNQIQHLLLIAELDLIVASQNSKDMHYALCRAGNQSVLERVPYAGHISLVGSLSSRFSHYFATKRLILNYLNRILG